MQRSWYAGSVAVCYESYFFSQLYDRALKALYANLVGIYAGDEGT